MYQLHRCREATRVPMGKGSAEMTPGITHSSYVTWQRLGQQRGAPAPSRAARLLPCHKICPLSKRAPFSCELGCQLPLRPLLTLFTSEQQRDELLSKEKALFLQLPPPHTHTHTTTTTPRFSPMQRAPNPKGKASPRSLRGGLPGHPRLPAVSGPTAPAALPPGATFGRPSRVTGHPPPSPSTRHQNGKCLRLKIHIYRARIQKEDGKTPPPFPLPTPSERR